MPLGIKRLGREGSIPQLSASQDTLLPAALLPVDAWLQGSAGIPATADSCAYESIQQLLAIGTKDGRVKMLGRAGVERCLRSQAEDPGHTVQLSMPCNRGVLLRICEAGVLESWALSNSTTLDDITPLDVLRTASDRFNCLDPFPRDPYLLLGCASGSLRVATIVDALGALTLVARQVRGLQLSPYKVTCAELEGEGGIVQVAVQSVGPLHRALAVFEQGMFSVWDLRASALLCMVHPEGSDAMTAVRKAGRTTAAAWIGTPQADFATGHSSGTIFLWGLQGVGPGPPVLLAPMRVVAQDAEPIRSLTAVHGKHTSLLVFGGQHQEQPDTLVLLPLPSSDKDDISTGLVEDHFEGPEDMADHRVKLPWFGKLKGYALVAAPAVLSGVEEPSSVLQLLEGGQLVSFDLRSSKPMPTIFSLPLQALPPITYTDAVVLPIHLPGPRGTLGHGLSLAGLRKVAADACKKAGRPDTAAAIGLGCGTPPKPASDATCGTVYITGCKDGHVGLWDVSSEAPALLATAPSAEAIAALEAETQPLRQVTHLHVAWEAGALVTGHGKGEVRLYQWLERPGPSSVLTFDSAGTSTSPALTEVEEPAGLQLRLRSLVHTAEICCVTYAPAIRSILVGDRIGGVSLIDLDKSAVLWYQTPVAQPVLSLHVCGVAMPTFKARGAGVEQDVAEGAEANAVLFATADGCVGVLELSTGFSVGRNGPLKPKNSSYTLCMEPLNHNGQPLWLGPAHHAGFSQSGLGRGQAGERKIDTTTVSGGGYGTSGGGATGGFSSPEAMSPGATHGGLRNTLSTDEDEPGTDVPRPPKLWIGRRKSSVEYPSDSSPMSPGVPVLLPIPLQSSNSPARTASVAHEMYFAPPAHPSDTAEPYRAELQSRSGDDGIDDGTSLEPLSQAATAGGRGGLSTSRHQSSTRVPAGKQLSGLGASTSAGTPTGAAPSGAAGVGGLGKQGSGMMAPSMAAEDGEEEVGSDVEVDGSTDDADDDDMDMDAYLAAAAAQVEKQARAKHRAQMASKLTLGLVRVRKAAADEAAMTAASPHRDAVDLEKVGGSSRAHHASSVKAGEHRAHSKRHHKVDEAPLSPSVKSDDNPVNHRNSGSVPFVSGSSTEGPLEPMTAETPAARTLLPSSAAHPLPPAEPASFVLLCTDLYIRIYALNHVLAADRHTSLRVMNASPLVYARTFHINGAPGLLTLASDADGLLLQLFTLPSLELLQEVPLPQAAGWLWDVPNGHCQKLNRLIATSRLGQMLLLGEVNELLQLTFAEGVPPPLLPSALYDWELAHAAHSANVVNAQSYALFIRPPPPPPIVKAARANSAHRRSDPHGDVGGPTGTSSMAASTNSPPKVTAMGLAGFGNVLSKVGLNISKNVEEGVKKLVSNVGHGVRLLEEGSHGHSHDILADYQHPTLAALFAPHAAAAPNASYMQPSSSPGYRQRQMFGSQVMAVNPSHAEDERYDDDDDVDTGSDEEQYAQPRTAANRHATSLSSAAPITRPSGSSSGGGHTEPRRTALHIGGLKDPNKGIPEVRARTASEIRRFYRPESAAAATKRSDNAHAVMHENRDKLAQRGEKLRQLDEKTADLEHSAAGFAEMAKALAESQKNRKWWQL